MIEITSSKIRAVLIRYSLKIEKKVLNLIKQAR